MNLEICVDSPSCAHLSLQSSANSVELCASLSVGGLTPSISAVASLANIHDKYPQSHVTILVRPREGNFIYTPAEKDLIISDVKTYKDLLSPHGLHSFTVGCLTSDSKLDADFLKTVNDLGVEITLHRCVDDILSLQTMSPSEIVETAAKSGVVRILTSGGKKTAVEGLMNIKKMVAYAREHYPLLTIIAGSGVTAENVNMFKEIGVECVHVGSGVKVNEEIEEHARSPLFGGERKVVDVEKVR
ncbi:hypothetical protein TL16_g07592 [Triparma laevis f. inornata]|nr:hypothetical protein TL16_g07592 [Triparma laevis f. inornata]